MTERSDTGSVGARLKLARESKGVTLRQIANTTRIAMSALDAIERDDVKKLPGGIFARSFVRAYASELKLDVEQTVSEFFAQFPEVVDGPAAPASTSPMTARCFGVPAGVLRGACWRSRRSRWSGGWCLAAGAHSESRPPAAERVAAPRPEVAPSTPARPASDVVPAGGAMPDASPAVPASASHCTSPRGRMLGLDHGRRARGRLTADGRWRRRGRARRQRTADQSGGRQRRRHAPRRLAGPLAGPARPGRHAPHRHDQRGRPGRTH